VFYLKYDMYRNSWPLLAMATYRNALAQAAARRNGAPSGEARPAPERVAG
jgi:hypothetical protein